jgi:hypothetical protein
MMYNYTIARVKDGKAPFIKWDEVNGVDREDLERWTKQYVTKKIASQVPAVADPEQLAFDLAEAQ